MSQSKYRNFKMKLIFFPQCPLPNPHQISSFQFFYQIINFCRFLSFFVWNNSDYEQRTSSSLQLFVYTSCISYSCCIRLAFWLCHFNNRNIFLWYWNLLYWKISSKLNQSKNALLFLFCIYIKIYKRER